MPAAIRPSPTLVRLAGSAAIVSLAAVPIPMLVAPALALAALIVVLAAIDLAISRRDPEPRVARALAGRLVRGRPATVVYRVSRPSGAATVVLLLDELPEVLGGDLVIDNVEVGGGQHRDISREVLPRRRGTFALGPMMTLWRSRLGFFRLRATAIAAGGTVAILPPASAPQRHGGLTHRSLRDEFGLRPRPARGEGSEFESLREYVPGDDPRHIDWRATARRNRLIVRQYQTERRHTVIVVVDTGRLMAAKIGGASKLDYAVECAVALSRASKEYKDRVGFIAFDRELRALVRPRPGLAGVGALTEATLKLKPWPFEPNYRLLVQTLASYQRKRALVVVLTDFVEGSAAGELETYMAALARRHCVMLVAMRDRLLAELDGREPGITRARLYRRLALQDLAVEREAALGRIARFGAQTLDLDPARITAPVLNRYLAIRRAGLL